MRIWKTECVACGEELIDGQDVIKIDGAYICDELSCLMEVTDAKPMILNLQGEYDDAMTDQALANREEDELLGGR